MTHQKVEKIDLSFGLEEEFIAKKLS